MVQTIPRRPLGNTGLSLSIIGFGASPLGSVFEQIDEDEGVRSVHEAFRLGINYFDVSPFYGATRAEQVLGRALQSLPRDEYILSTKVGRYGESDFDFRAERVAKSVEESCRRLNTDRIDILIAHDIEFGNLDQIVNETLPAMVKLRESGKIACVGISGLPLGTLRQVVERAPAGTLDMVLSYCHYSLNDTSLTSLLPLLEERGIGVINASPFSMGLLTPQGPPAWHPAPQALQEVCRNAAGWCQQHNVSLPRLAVQFSTHLPAISSSLVGCCTTAQVKENVDAILQAEQSGGSDEKAIKIVQGLLVNQKDVTWPSGRPENC